MSKSQFPHTGGLGNPNDPLKKGPKKAAFSLKPDNNRGPTKGGANKNMGGVRRTNNSKGR